MSKAKIRGARLGKSRRRPKAPVVVDTPEVEEKVEETPSKPKVKLCTVCEKKPANMGRKCSACYMRDYRKRRSTEFLPDGSLNPAYVPAKGHSNRKEMPIEQLYEEMANQPMLTQADVDSSVIRASTESGMLPTNAPEKPSIGYQRLWLYLRQFDAHFRRRIIARMQALGMDRLDILSAFLSDPKLRERWVDPLRNPRLAFDRDFAILEKKKPQSKKKSGDALREYIERLTMLERMALDLANNEKATTTIRREMIQLAAKLSRDLALLEDAIRIVPTQGDLPTHRAQRAVTGRSVDDDEEDAEDLEDDLESGIYELPAIETGG